MFSDFGAMTSANPVLGADLELNLVLNEPTFIDDDGKIIKLDEMGPEEI